MRIRNLLALLSVVMWLTAITSIPAGDGPTSSYHMFLVVFLTLGGLMIGLYAMDEKPPKCKCGMD